MEQAEYEKKYFPLCSQAGDLLFSGLSILVHDSPEQDQLGFFFPKRCWCLGVFQWLSLNLESEKAG